MQLGKKPRTRLLWTAGHPMAAVALLVRKETAGTDVTEHGTGTHGAGMWCRRVAPPEIEFLADVIILEEAVRDAEHGVLGLLGGRGDDSV